MKHLLIAALCASAFMAGAAGPAAAQVAMTPQQILFYTSEWTGERFPDGRPKVPDGILERLKAVSIEEAWGTLRQAGYNNQFDTDFKTINDHEFVGRALTVQYMPLRPDMNKAIEAQGKKEGRIGQHNSWPIDMLQTNDVYVADGYGKLVDGTLIGDRLGNSIFARSKTGVVFDGSVRDIEGLGEIKGFNAFVRGWDPSFIREMEMTQINGPIRIGRATVLPGDLVLAKREGVVFIPAHLAEQVVIQSERTALLDGFSFDMVKSGRYTAGQVDQKWTPEMNTAFRDWVRRNPQRVKMSKADLDKFLSERFPDGQ